MFKNYNFYFTSDPIWFAGVLTRASAILLPWVQKLDQQNQEIGQIFALVFKSNLNQKLKKKRCKLDLVLIKIFGCDYRTDDLRQITLSQFCSEPCHSTFCKQRLARFCPNLVCLCSHRTAHTWSWRRCCVCRSAS